MARIRSVKSERERKGKTEGGREDEGGESERGGRREWERREGEGGRIGGMCTCMYHRVTRSKQLSVRIGQCVALPLPSFRMRFVIRLLFLFIIQKLLSYAWNFSKGKIVLDLYQEYDILTINICFETFYIQGILFLNNALRFLKNYDKYGKIFQTKVVWFEERHKWYHWFGLGQCRQDQVKVISIFF